MSWQEDLDKKQKEFNLPEEVKENVRIRSNSNINSGGSISDRVSIPEKRRENLNIVKKEEHKMVSKDNAHSDLDKVAEEILREKDKYTPTEAIVKVTVGCFKILVTFLSTIRSNQLLTEPEKVEIRKKQEEIHKRVEEAKKK